MEATTFSKRERIVSTKLVGELFGGASSASVAAYPLRAVWLVRPRAEAADAPVQVLMSVPKRRFHHAVDRNRIKRQLREAYRRQRPLLAAHVAPDCQVAVAFIWLSDDHFPSLVVADRMRTLLTRIAHRL